MLGKIKNFNRKLLKNLCEKNLQIKKINKHKFND